MFSSCCCCSRSCSWLAISFCYHNKKNREWSIHLQRCRRKRGAHRTPTNMLANARAMDFLYCVVCRVFIPWMPCRWKHIVYTTYTNTRAVASNRHNSKWLFFPLFPIFRSSFLFLVVFKCMGRIHVQCGKMCVHIRDWMSLCVCVCVVHVCADSNDALPNCVTWKFVEMQWLKAWVWTQNYIYQTRQDYVRKCRCVCLYACAACSMCVNVHNIIDNNHMCVLCMCVYMKSYALLFFHSKCRHVQLDTLVRYYIQITNRHSYNMHAFSRLLRSESTVEISHTLTHSLSLRCVSPYSRPSCIRFFFFRKLYFSDWERIRLRVHNCMRHGQESEQMAWMAKEEQYNYYLSTCSSIMEIIMCDIFVCFSCFYFFYFYFVCTFLIRFSLFILLFLNDVGKLLSALHKYSSTTHSTRLIECVW